MTSTEEYTPIVPSAPEARIYPEESTYNREELLTLAQWLTAQERLRRQGKKSEWAQDVWVRLSDVAGDDDTDEYTGEEHLNVETQAPRPAWSCGTAACAAGHVTLMHGGLPVWEKQRTKTEFWREPTEPSEPWDNLSDTHMEVNGEVYLISVYAAHRLGLNNPDANTLFAGHNRWLDMLEIIGRFLGMGLNEMITHVHAENMPEDPDAY